MLKVVPTHATTQTPPTFEKWLTGITLPMNFEYMTSEMAERLYEVNKAKHYDDYEVMLYIELYDDGEMSFILNIYGHSYDQTYDNSADADCYAYDITEITAKEAEFFYEEALKQLNKNLKSYPHKNHLKF